MHVTKDQAQASQSSPPLPTVRAERRKLLNPSRNWPLKLPRGAKGERRAWRVPTMSVTSQCSPSAIEACRFCNAIGPKATSPSHFARSVIEGRRDSKFSSPETSAADADRRATEAASYDTCLPNIRIPRKVLKGGSHLCAQVVGTARFAVVHP
jgi:hypothetical protein